MNLILEIFTEEIPSKMQAKAASDFRDIFQAEFVKVGIEHKNLNVCHTPKLLILTCELESSVNAITIEIKGPKITSPSHAIDGFCRSNNITQDFLEQKSEYYIYNKTIPARLTSDILLELLPSILLDYTWPKSMLWGDYSLRWARPIRNIACLLDNKVLPIKVGHLIGNADVKSNSSVVIYDQKERKAKIINDLRRVCLELQVRLLEDETLIDEVNGLVDNPKVMVGAIKDEFLKIPSEILVSSMRTHQKYFSTIGHDGNFAPYFLFVSNNPNGGERVVHGNEKVLAARLSDAAYFYQQDLKTTQKERNNKLKLVTFHAKLGTIWDKVQRIVQLTQFLYPENVDLHVAASLCKADLVSHVISEFPELQGVMGYYYAKNDEFSAQIANGIKDHYKPDGANDNQVPNGIAAILSIVDKIDTIVGMMLVGLKPTGSKDPYALRRSAIGIIRVILDNKLSINLKHLVSKACMLHNKEFNRSLGKLSSGGEMQGASCDLDVKAILEFIEDRAKIYLQEESKVELVRAVIDLNIEPDLFQSKCKLEALRDSLDWIESLMPLYKRVTNISSPNEDIAIDESLFNSNEEKELYRVLQSVTSMIDNLLKQNKFRDGLCLLYELDNPLNQFFNKLMINDKDPKIASNRMAILCAIRRLFCKILNFDCLINL